MELLAGGQPVLLALVMLCRKMPVTKRMLEIGVESKLMSRPQFRCLHTAWNTASEKYVFCASHLLYFTLKLQVWPWKVMVQRQEKATWMMPAMKPLFPTVRVLKSHYGFQTNLVIWLVEFIHGLTVYIIVSYNCSTSPSYIKMHSFATFVE